MTNYTDILKNSLARINHLYENTVALRRDLSDIERELRLLRSEIASFVNGPSYHVLNARIVRKMNSFLEKGESYEASILETAELYGVPPVQVDTVYHFEGQKKKIIEKFAKFWIIRRLKKMRYKNREIANVCQFSEKYLYDVFKKQKKAD